ncbi:hypothetical protein [Candidatus Kryptobacter tengchongensis]|uniref:PorV/PorQ family protein n=1 Tax=Kryptobacter tengchongensis TaxID=1643429 RepID=A0A916LKD7_KRYT1|nr:hypothetical protein [Candidatus Kryptobacter tengchongensis]CUT00998.1 hypothetical protein JGI25_00822 [Candidatus Kryptobacter tengchongensis]
MLKILIFLCLIISKIFPQENLGARAFALKSYVIPNDVWAIFYNPAGLADLKIREISFSYIPAQFGLKELSKKGFVFCETSLPVKVGVGAEIFGFELYKEGVVKFSVARDFDLFNLGLNLNYNFASIKGYGNAGAFSADLGFISKSVRFFKFGFVLKNLIAGKIGRAKEKLSKEIELGVALLPYDNLMVSTSIYKETGFKESLKYGVEYEFANLFALRFGFSNYPAQYSGGAGIKFTKFQFDYGVNNHQLLGLTHQVTLTAKLGWKK